METVSRDLDTVTLYRDKLDHSVGLEEHQPFEGLHSGLSAVLSGGDEVGVLRV